MTINFTEDQLMLIEKSIWEYAESVQETPFWMEEYAKVKTVSDKIWKIVNKYKKQKENKKTKEILDWADSVINKNECTKKEKK